MSETIQLQTERRSAVADRYLACRAFTEAICQTLEVEDFVVQSMADASPVKWHLGHTTWFFETFLLVEFDPDYFCFDERLAYLFNSYYVQAGERFTRSERGLLSRPTVEEIFEYRKHVDAHVATLVEHLEDDSPEKDDLFRVLQIGINHEQQHQELILTDVKHLFSHNPLHPSLSNVSLPKSSPPPALSWVQIPEGVYEIGTDDAAFFFDNESPKHRYFIEPFELASRTVTNGEYLDFMEDGGYFNQLLWLSEGWNTVAAEKWNRPLYWSKQSDEWFEFSLHGLVKLDRNAPVCHISYFEADAFARWASVRLPSEFEWETALKPEEITGNFAENRIYHPVDTSGEDGPVFRHPFGNVWEWTRSQYSPYPGYKAPAGALGEYNGKFMSNQFVLRGGSCATPWSHLRPTYRNFFPARARWQFSGIRLARDR